MSRYERLKGCADLVSFMYGKKCFSIPTMNKNIDLSNGKKIQVVLGNATNMMNLTYGERTSSCMRKGRAFNNLFEYCATNENGFHIRFVNPETGKFVSRVSGIRNGNTVFLNELRVSLDDEYSNADLYESIKNVAQSLIQMSRNSQFHIDNVLITSDYALEEYKGENQELNLSVDNKKIVLRNLSFNYDTKGILLANSVNSNVILPYEFSDDVPKYDSIRDDVKIYHGSSAVNRIMQIKIINDLINGVSLDNVNTEFTDEIPDYIISGEDYYISFKNDKTHVFLLDSCRENQRTLSEINQILASKNISLDRELIDYENYR